MGELQLKKNTCASKRWKITTKCAGLVKEQRARIYILRRCATMLLCSYIEGDD